MILLFQNILFLKELLPCNGCFGLFTKIKKGLGLAFGAHFLHGFSIKMLIFCQLTKFQCYTFFPSQDITKYDIKFLWRQLMTLFTLRFIFDHSLKQWPTGKKSGEDGNTKIWISRKRKELFRWNKKHFS